MRGGTKPDRAGLKCFNCKQRGHIASKCPHNALLCAEQGRRETRDPRVYYRRGRVEGVQVSDFILDTGCTQTMVRHELVPEEKILVGEAVTVR